MIRHAAVAMFHVKQEPQVYIVTAWDDDSETTVRVRDPAIALARATALASQGMKITIIRTATGEALAVTDLQTEIDHAKH